MKLNSVHVVVLTFHFTDSRILFPFFEEKCEDTTEVFHHFTKKQISFLSVYPGEEKLITCTPFHYAVSQERSQAQVPIILP